MQFGIALLLIVQLWIFSVSLGSDSQLSPFCTAAHIAWLNLFALVHVALLAIFVLGLAALRTGRLRRLYLILLAVTLPLLLLQPWLVAHGLLYCDGP